LINIIIDTNIWHYAYVEPKEENYLEIHEQAERFLKDTLINPILP
jgi:predicted nucleic acid-binding protein